MNGGTPAGLGGGSRTARNSVLVATIPPVLWTIFLWLYIVVASDVLYEPFYFLVRGGGAVLAPSSITIFPGSTDLDLLLAISGAILTMHLVLLAADGRRRLPGAVTWLALAACATGFAIQHSLLMIGLLGASFAASFVVEGATASDLCGAPASRLFAYFAVGSVAVLSVLAVASSLRWAAAGIDGSVPSAGWGWAPAYVGLQLIGLLDPILPQLALLFFFAWAFRLGLSTLLGEPPAPRAGTAMAGEGTFPGRGLEGQRLSLALLGAALLLAAVVAVYPYLPAVNPGRELVGVDVYFCYSHVLDSQPFVAAGSGACSGSLNAYAIQRLGAVEMLRGLAYLTGSNDAGLEVAPLVLALLLTVSTYLLVLEGTRDQLAAGVSALLASVSPEVIAGINAGLLANWLAISVAFLFFASLLRALRTRRPRYVLLSCAVFVGLLFVHPWTWALTLVVLTVFLSVTLLESAWRHELRSKRLEAGMLVTILAAGLAADGVRSFLPQGSGLATALATLVPGLQLSNVPLALTNLRLTFVTFLLGAFADPVWFVLGLVGVLSMPSLGGRFAKLLIAWVALTSIGVVLLSPASVDTLQARVIYDVPLQVFASLGLLAILRPLVRSLQGRAPLGERSEDLVLLLVLVGVVGLLLGFALDNTGSLYPPSYLR